MALLRLISFPSTYHSSTHNLSSHPHQSSSTNPFSYIIPIKTTKHTLFLTHVSSSTQTQSTSETNNTLQNEKENGKEELDEEDDGSSGNRLLAQNVPWLSTADDIRPLFEKYGTVLDIEMSMYNKIRNRGLAFVTMNSNEEAFAAITNLQSYEFEGRTLNMTWAKPKKTPSPPMKPKPVPVHNLFIANLPFQARAKDLKEHFNNANVVAAEIIFHDNPRRSAGYGFVSFNTKEEAEAALSNFQGKMFMGRRIRLARSRRFLRQETNVAIRPKGISSESDAGSAESEKVSCL